ncbi:MAG: Peptidoglycan glycosyltransferase [Cyanobacteria bacterium RYN_339]|nr:Peptidoglycan glycosyltransferase [Cyanobacteria bacterium RYN_339]
MIRALLLAAAGLVLAASVARDPFQLACERLAGTRAIAIVALDPATGRLRALVHPQLAQEAYPPGSVFKLVTALAAVEEGLAPAGRDFLCTGAYKVPGAKGPPLPCYKADGHGHVALEEALGLSCNATFYALGSRLGAPRLRATAERCGLVPAPGAWLKAPRDARALAQLGIGEGPAIGLTAERLAGFVAAIAVNGPVVTPAWEPGPLTGPPLAKPEVLARLRAGMRAAVVRGTAKPAAVPGLAVAGKTGTSTYLDGSNRTHGWFVGYAPAERPRLVVAVFAKEGTGFGTASALAGQVFRAWPR